MGCVAPPLPAVLLTTSRLHARVARCHPIQPLPQLPNQTLTPSLEPLPLPPGFLSPADSAGYHKQTARCWLPRGDCTCDEVSPNPSLLSNIVIWLYMHPKDFFRRNNTRKLPWQVAGGEHNTVSSEFSAFVNHSSMVSPFALLAAPTLMPAGLSAAQQHGQAAVAGLSAVQQHGQAAVAGAGCATPLCIPYHRTTSSFLLTHPTPPPMLPEIFAAQQHGHLLWFETSQNTCCSRCKGSALPTFSLSVSPILPCAPPSSFLQDFLRRNNTGKLLWQVLGGESARLCVFGINAHEERMWDELKRAGECDGCSVCV
ncbi:unnamed protein product [Closterium sp. Yama58-4]|nr:unnamed protein product [Closterium sp. Yama58-4]